MPTDQEFSALQLLVQHLANQVPPVGTIHAYAGTNLPPTWLFCDGQPLLRADYPELFAVIQASWGQGDGSTTFNLPDLRDQFLRGASDSRQVGSRESDGTAMPKKGFTIAPAGNHGHNLHGEGRHVHYYPGSDVGHVLQNGNARIAQNGHYASGHNASPMLPAGDHTHVLDENGDHGHTLNGGDAETRPCNVAVQWIIRAV